MWHAAARAGAGVSHSHQLIFHKIFHSSFVVERRFFSGKDITFQRILRNRLTRYHFIRILSRKRLRNRYRHRIQKHLSKLQKGVKAFYTLEGMACPAGRRQRYRRSAYDIVIPGCQMCPVVSSRSFGLFGLFGLSIRLVA